MELRLDLARGRWIVIAGDSAGALVDVLTYGCGHGRAKLSRPLGRPAPAAWPWALRWRAGWRRLPPTVPFAPAATCGPP